VDLRTLRLFAALAAVLLIAPAAIGDTVTLTNGDRISGNVLAEANGKLVIETPYAGKITVDMEIVADYDGIEDDYVTYAPGSALLGPVAALAAEKEEPKSPWDGKLELGAFFTDGNTDRRGGNLGLTVTHEGEKTKFTGKATATYAEENGERTTNEQFVSLREDYTHWKPWYVFALLSFERDEFEEIDLRAIFAPGAGRKLADSEDFKLNVELGPTVTYIDYKTEGEDSDTEFEGRLAFHAELAVFDSAKLTEDLEVFVNLDDVDQYRIVSETAFTQPLSEAWYFKLSVIDKYNSEPKGDAKRNDIEVRLSLVFDF
jgi:putative salt-induced outer membrane protein